MRLKGKTALIAGAGRNNGKVIALTFAREGADLILIARKRGDELNKVAKECEALGGHSALTAPGPYRAAMAASKHGLIKALAQSFGPYGVRANLLSLAHIENVRENPEWYPHTGGLDDKDAKVRITPLGRLGRPQEVADVAVFLASDESSYVTGDRICCNGGSYM